MNQFITFREEDKNGELQYYILQRDHPHYVGFITPIPNEESLQSSPIPGYNLYVQFSGTLRGNFIQMNPSYSSELMSVYNDMASDAGHKHNTDENEQMAAAIEEQQRRDWERETYKRIDDGEFEFKEPKIQEVKQYANRS